MTTRDPKPRNGDRDFGGNEFDNQAVFTDRVESRKSTADLVDRSYTGSLDALVYPDDLMGIDFARRGGQVMVFKIFTRKSQKIDLSQEASDALQLGKETASFVGQELGEVVGLSDIGYQGLSDESREAAIRIAGEDQYNAANSANFVGDEESARRASFQVNRQQARFGQASEELKDQVVLYIPKGLVFDNSVEFEESSMAGLGALTQAIASGFANTSALTSTLGLQLLKTAGSVTKNVGIDIEGGLRARAGFANNPKNEMIFKGPKRNDFSFEFEFAPRTEKEARTATEIIDVFRYYMSPEISLSTTVYFAPQEFDISIVNILEKQVQNAGSGETATFSSTENTTLPKIGRCYLENVKVDYTPDDRSAFFRNGQATRILMSLKFTQINYVTKQGILAGF